MFWQKLGKFLGLVFGTLFLAGCAGGNFLFGGSGIADNYKINGKIFVKIPNESMSLKFTYRQIDSDHNYLKLSSTFGVGGWEITEDPKGVHFNDGYQVYDYSSREVMCKYALQQYCPLLSDWEKILLKDKKALKNKPYHVYYAGNISSKNTTLPRFISIYFAKNNYLKVVINSFIKK